MSNKKGFSLVEVLVVVAVLSIILSLILSILSSPNHSLYNSILS